MYPGQVAAGLGVFAPAFPLPHCQWPVRQQPHSVWSAVCHLRSFRHLQDRGKGQFVPVGAGPKLHWTHSCELPVTHTRGCWEGRKTGVDKCYPHLSCPQQGPQGAQIPLRGSLQEPLVGAENVMR